MNYQPIQDRLESIHDILDNPFCNFTKYFGIGGGKTVSIPFVLPTLARRLIKKQTIFDTDPKLDENFSTKSTPEKKGFWTGYTFGAAGVMGFLGYALGEASNKNYLPLSILVLSNIYNLGHEVMCLEDNFNKDLEDKLDL
jgi:hypothetical protein